MNYKKNKYKKVSVYLIACLLCIYFIGNTQILNFLSKKMLNYWLIPSVWLIIILVMRYKIPKIHGFGKLRYRSTVYIWAFNCGVAWVIINLLGGMVEGFGKSPYSHSLSAIIANFFYVGMVLIGREFIRAYLMNTYSKENFYKALVGVIALMTLTEINIFKIFELNSLQSWAIYLSEQLLPVLSKNILATHLVAYGGIGASAICLGMREAFEWLSPILPDLDWLAKGVIGIVVPIGCLMIITERYRKLTREAKEYKEKEESFLSWFPAAILSVVLIWFTVGVFPVYPSAIATGSMQPMIDPGDVVLVRKVESQEELEALQIGDVIQFRRGNILINHRIIDIQLDEETGLYFYQTKGDNNSAIDQELVEMEDVKGTIIGVIPKIGWPTLIFKNKNPDILKEVEF